MATGRTEAVLEAVVLRHGWRPVSGAATSGDCLRARIESMGARLRLADLLAGLSIVVDLGYGLPLETAMRACLVGTALARRMGLSEREAAEVFYVSLLLHIGCLAYSHETIAWFGDDAAVHRAVVRTNHPAEIVTVLIPEATRDLPTLARLRSVACSRRGARGSRRGMTWPVARPPERSPAA
jgi:hypothetical protein